MERALNKADEAHTAAKNAQELGRVDEDVRDAAKKRGDIAKQVKAIELLLVLAGESVAFAEFYIAALQYGYGSPSSVVKQKKLQALEAKFQDEKDAEVRWLVREAYEAVGGTKAI
jgi:hypothetical protein